MEQLDVLSDAILERRRIVFVYKGLQRLVEPYIIGCDADGVQLMQGWQMAGDGTGSRTFHVASMSVPELTDSTFDRIRMTFACDRSRFTIIHRAVS